MMSTKGFGLREWLGGMVAKRQQQQAEAMAVQEAIEKVVEIADPHIRGSSGYRKALRESVIAASEYCSALLETVPGPVQLTRKGYYDDPLVKAIFPSPEALEEFLRISPELAGLRKQPDGGEVVALLTMSREEKTIFGHQQQGEMVLRDVAQRSVNFYEHRLIAPSVDVDVTKNGIRHRGLEVLATIAMEKIETLQSWRSELQQKKEYLRATLKILGGRTRLMESFAMPAPGKWEEYRKAEQLLAEVETDLVKARAEIGTPEQSLGYLHAVLQKPADLLQVRQESLRLNWMNVMTDDAEADANTVVFAEFFIPDIVSRSALLVTFPASAML